MSEPQMCDNCRYFSESTDKESETGFCRRFPCTEEKRFYEWCGEWQKKPERDETMGAIKEALKGATIVAVSDTEGAK